MEANLRRNLPDYFKTLPAQQGNYFYTQAFDLRWGVLLLWIF